ncbi:hypothetical protein KVH07_07040 [Streptomyces olivaceus]|uniref:hypothetical protein n=2 Tax=Streptomyces TaxID=1883 RepID=UPI001892B916|nr:MULTISPECIES: hypothetical protein [Streptomyces]MBZ6192687.1 hypothetical protein [Streptomyces olivaceus]MCC2265235.1 hypothetical protein [Streptomyces sp. CT1-17]
MPTAPAGPDPTMDAIGQAVTEGRTGSTLSARRKLLGLWFEIGITGDPLHRCSLAHYLADLYEDPAQALAWDVRALDAADAMTDQRAQEHHAGLRVAGFYPSLHLNLADNYRRLGSFDAATAHLHAAEEHVPDLPQDAYGALLRTALDEVAQAVSRRDTTKRPRRTPE